MKAVKCFTWGSVFPIGQTSLKELRLYKMIKMELNSYEKKILILILPGSGKPLEFEKCKLEQFQGKFLEFQRWHQKRVQLHLSILETYISFNHKMKYCTIALPIKATDTIQKLRFEALDYYVKLS